MNNWSSHCSDFNPYIPNAYIKCNCQKGSLFCCMWKETSHTYMCSQITGEEMALKPNLDLLNICAEGL